MAAGRGDGLVEGDRAGADAEVGVDALVQDASDAGPECVPAPGRASGSRASGPAGRRRRPSCRRRSRRRWPLRRSGRGRPRGAVRARPTASMTSVDPRLEPAAGERDEAAAEPPAAPAPGRSRIATPEVALDDRGEVGEVAVEVGDHRRGRPPSAARRRPRPRAGRRAGCRRRRRPRPRPPSSSRSASPTRRSGRAGPAAPPPGRARGPRRRAGGSRAPGPDPAPPSLVALPPMPRITRLRPGVDRGEEQLAGPRVVVRDGSRRSGGTRTRPEAAAISMTAVRPSPSSPNARVHGLAERAR